jgi:glycine/D-amino acid oxidase-like deaminating enzyme/nitrite reductase/ring-hydroxylating ferredoxin subunit
MIQRDGNCTSLWQDHIEAYRATNKPSENQLYDAVIVGGGITGITTAMLLQEAGKKCLVIEAANLCFGTTGGTTAHLNTLLDTPYATIIKNFDKEKARLVAQVTAEAIDLVRSNIGKYKIDCEFEEADAYLFARDKKQTDELKDIKDACTDVGLEVAYAEKIPVPISFETAMQVKGQAKFNPVKYVYGLAKAFEDAGGVIRQECRVMSVHENETAEIETTDGTFRAQRVIYATHIPPGVNLIHLRCAPYRSYAMAVQLERGDYPADLAYDMYDPYHYYRTQIVDGQPYLIVGGYDHKTAHEENTNKCFRELEAHVQEYFDVSKVVYQWSSQYFEPADGLPYIGRLPGHTDLVYVASGFGGNGITYSQVSALVLKSILLNEESPYVDLFNPNRIKPVAGFKNFITHNADVVAKFVGKFFSHEKLEELVDVAPGEGKVVVYDGEKIALHKDENGQLHAISSICTHFKCSVAWNNAEQSWDCPCHGARYSHDGEVLTGPASVGLERISIEEAVAKS